MQTTPLTDKHIALGAKMTDFAGFNMPISYTSLKEEHLAVRNEAGVFDVSHMGEFIIRGEGALELVQKVTTNNAAKLKAGQAQYSCMTNEQGGIVDDLLVYKLTQNLMNSAEDAFLLVVNASNIEKDWNWIKSHNSFGATMENISAETGLLAVQGPKAIAAIQSLTEVVLDDLKYYTFTQAKFADQENIIISATGYTGAGGVEIYGRNEQIVAIWDQLFEAAQQANIDLKPVGLGARDTLRLEKGYCLYGNDLDDTTTPIEAGLGWITKTKKGDFVGREVLVKQRKEGVTRKLVAFLVDDRRVCRHDYLIENQEETPIGKVTSGTLSPCLGKPIGLGYVETAYAQEGTNFFIPTGRKKLKATVVKLPFV